MKRDIFQQKVSAWISTSRNENTRRVVSLGEFLQWGTSYTNYSSQIPRLRQIYDEAQNCYPTNPARSEQLFLQYKDEKRQLALCTPGGLFAKGGNKEDIIEHTNIMQIDIDATKPTEYESKMRELGFVPNAGVKDWQLVKRILSKFPFVAFASLSVSGRGVYALIPIADHRRHEDYWQTLQKVLFRNFRLYLDAKAKGESHPRFVSIDEAAYINRDAEVFDFAKPKLLTCHPSATLTTPRNSTEEDVFECLRKIEANRIDVTGNYNDWCGIAAALHSQFGDSGEDLFVRFSQFHPEASESRSRKKYKECRTMSRISIGTLFKICSDYGIRYTTPRPAPTPPPPPSPPPSAKADAAAPRIIYKFGESFPQPFDYMAIYDNLQLPEDFFTERQEAAPF